MKFLYGPWVRLQACRMAAQVMQGRMNGDEAITPLVWSLTVFFEHYLWEGATGTRDDFGPKDPAKIQDFRTALTQGESNE